MSHEMELEDYLVSMKRKVAVVEEQNQALREQNSRLTLALDEALSIARKYRGDHDEQEEALSNLVEGMLVGRVDFGESSQARSASYSAEDAMAVSIVRLYHENDELRAEVAMLREQARILAEERDEARAMLERKWAEQDPPLIRMMQERDEARMQYRTTELLGVALVKTIDELKTEKAELFAKLVNLQAGSRRATLDEIAESVRDKYEPEHDREEMQNG